MCLRNSNRKKYTSRVAYIFSYKRWIRWADFAHWNAHNWTLFSSWLRRIRWRRHNINRLLYNKWTSYFCILRTGVEIVRKFFFFISFIRWFFTAKPVRIEVHVMPYTQIAKYCVKWGTCSFLLFVFMFVQTANASLLKLDLEWRANFDGIHISIFMLFWLKHLQSNHHNDTVRDSDIYDSNLFRCVYLSYDNTLTTCVCYASIQTIENMCIHCVCVCFGSIQWKKNRRTIFRIHLSLRLHTSPTTIVRHEI